VKIALIGGAGVRSPLLVRGLATSDLPITEIALFDPDRERLVRIASVARVLAPNVAIVTCATSAEAITGADFVVTSIRPGGIEARARDEVACLAEGVLGQETIGPAGFAMALRTIGPMVEYAREVERLAPRAWIINFTNPVGIVTQAVRQATSARIVGICDTPTELYEGIASALGVASEDCRFDYVGLNHLGYVREVYYRGEPLLARLIADPVRLARVYRTPLFSAARIAELGLLPTEYVYYYDSPKAAIANLRAAGATRGRAIEELNARLFADLTASGGDVAAIYRRYLDDRNAGYMQLESGAAAPIADAPWAQLAGYDKIGVAVIRAIHRGTGEILPLDVANDGNVPELAAGDVVEAPCAIGTNGPAPLRVGALPDAVRPLVVEVKRYERLTVEAALARDPVRAKEALADHPLVRSTALAERLWSVLDPTW
jgi:6-phospho-beta-glucosidase